jgi:predicted deacylase
MSPARKKIWLVAFVITLGVGLATTWALLPEPLIAPEPEEKVVPQIATTTTEAAKQIKNVIGASVEGRVIESYTFGTGPDNLLFVGGIHGGYEWNSVLLAYQFIEELETGKFTLPTNLTVTVIPALNPDGLYAVINKEGRFTAEEIPPNDAHLTGLGRFNANEVDLNRNFDCKWQSTSTWKGKTVAAGTSAFSEPEAVALRDLVNKISPQAVVFWHSQANTVYASECKAGVLPQTLLVMDTYAKAAQYNSVASFDAYPVSGDAEGWLASIGIPAITVELETRTSPEWERNKSGIGALLKLYSN